MLGRGATKDPTIAVEAARAEVQRLHAAEVSIGDEWRALRARLPRVEMAAASAVVAEILGDPLAPEASQVDVAAARARRDALVAATAEVRSRRRAAIGAAYVAEAASLRARAAQLRADADKRQLTTDRLLAQLEAHEGLRFVPPSTLIPQSGPTVTGGVEYLRPYPRTVMMRRTAAALDRQAEELERRAPTDRGAFVAASVDEIVERLRGWDAMELAPPLPEVIECVERETAALQARLSRVRTPAGQGLGASELEYEIVWRNGHHDATASEVRTSALRQVQRQYA
jgi:hypothetical protein